MGLKRASRVPQPQHLRRGLGLELDRDGFCSVPKLWELESDAGTAPARSRKSGVVVFDPTVRGDRDPRAAPPNLGASLRSFVWLIRHQPPLLSLRTSRSLVTNTFLLKQITTSQMNKLLVAKIVLAKSFTQLKQSPSCSQAELALSTSLSVSISIYCAFGIS
jgi:hypothetical protein